MLPTVYFENGKIKDLAWKKSKLVVSRQVVTNPCCSLAVADCGLI